jgi:hypothetical protein
MPGGVSSYYSGTPAEMVAEDGQSGASLLAADTEEEAKARQYVIAWRNQLKQLRWQKRQIWNECWQLYRGLDDWTNLEDWQTKIVIPKAFNSVKTATNVIKRLMVTAKQPWSIESVNPDDLVNVIRAEKCTDLLKVFTEKAHLLEEFSEALECSFIIGLGVWKVWWGLVPRTSVGVEESFSPIDQLMQQGMPGGLGPNAASGQVTSEVAGQGNYGNLPSAAGPQPGGNELAPQSAQAGGGMQQAGSGMPQKPQGPPPGYTSNYGVEQGVPTEPPPPRNVIGQLSRPDWLAKTMAQLYPTQLPFEEIAPMNAPAQGAASNFGTGGSMQQRMVKQKQIIKKTTLEGNLFIRAVDPYNFYWLPGAKFPNRMIGTIEDVEVAKWELIEMADRGLFSKDKIAAIKPQKIDEYEKMSALRWSETVRAYNGPNTDTGVVKLTEYYGPVVYDGKIVKREAHCLIANDSVTLFYRDNELWDNSSPYIAFSPLALPFRTEGVGLIEMVRQIDKAMNRIANLSTDLLMFKLLPTFEYAPDAYENPEDFETGLVPGKMFRRNIAQMQAPPITPVNYADVSPGAANVMGLLDKFHGEGAMVTDVSQGQPRYRGIQTATESQLLQQNMDSFMGNMAVDVEKLALEPLLSKCLNLMFQFIDTATDPRVASVLGVDAEVLQGLTKPELLEMVQGDYKVKVRGISEQLWKADVLQQLVQLMNLVGQNPQAWLPYINEDALLRRILDSFRPQIHDIENIIADPDTAQAKRIAMSQEATTSDLLRLIPQLATLAHQTNQDKDAQSLAQQKAMFEQQMSMKELELKQKELQMQGQQNQAQAQQASGAASVATVPNNMQTADTYAGPGASGGASNMSTVSSPGV